MARYLIHTHPSRMWYVTDYLIPSMADQGIMRDHISIWNDANGNGCLKSTMASFASIERNGSGLWHLQDDIVICRDFKQLTEDYDAGLICGYCYDSGDERVKETGYTTAKNAWFSFPCIRIPNGLARDVGEWFFKVVLPDGLFPELVVTGKHDDTIFMKYLEAYRADEFVYNFTPTLVAHVDYLIGGSLLNKNRSKEKDMALYFKDHGEVEELKEKLKRNGREVNTDG